MQKRFLKIIFGVVDLIFLAIGSGVLVFSFLLAFNSDSDNDIEAASEGGGIGAFMVVLGLLIKNWRKGK